MSNRVRYFGLLVRAAIPFAGWVAGIVTIVFGGSVVSATLWLRHTHHHTLAVIVVAAAVIILLLEGSFRLHAKVSTQLEQASNAPTDDGPTLALLPDEDLVYSRVEGDGRGYVRLLVTNRPDGRAAHGSRVLVERCLSSFNSIITFGSPSLGWPSAPEAADGSLTVFAGATRAIDLGILFRAPIGPRGDQVNVAELRDVVLSPDLARTRTGLPILWCMKLAFHGLTLVDGRDILVPGNCVVRLTVAADEVEARDYDVKVFWNGNADTAEDALRSVEILISETPLF